MKPLPRLKEDFIVNEKDYQVCKAWLDEANAETILHPLGNRDLEEQRQHIKSLIGEYEENWRNQKRNS